MSVEAGANHSEQPKLTVSLEGREGGEVLRIKELDHEISVYDLRNLKHQEEAARLVARGGRMAMYGGVWGGFRAVKSWDIEERFFHQVKAGRPQEAKIPLMTLPEDAIRMIDWSRVNKDFRFLEHYWNFKKLWELHGAFLHIIAPVRETLGSLPPIFVTSPHEFNKRYPNSTPVSFSTIANVYREDPYLRHFSTLVKRFSHTDMYIGVSTLNPHGEEPPYTFDEFKRDLAVGRIPAESVDLIVKDDLYEGYEAFSSHTQLRLPFDYEEPAFRVLRIGSLSPKGFRDATGFKCVLDPDAKDVRKNRGENLDGKLKEMMAEIKNLYETQKPVVNIRA